MKSRKFDRGTNRVLVGRGQFGVEIKSKFVAAETDYVYEVGTMPGRPVRGQFGLRIVRIGVLGRTKAVAPSLRLSKPRKYVGRSKGQSEGGTVPSGRGQEDPKLEKSRPMRQKVTLGLTPMTEKAGADGVERMTDGGLTKRSIDDPKKSETSGPKSLRKPPEERLS
jgi:hypothetical protein